MVSGVLHRNRLASFGKAEGVYRALVIGDSMVYGHGVSEWETLPASLQRVLNLSRLGRAFECLNEGVCGYSVHHAWERFASFGYRYEPDLVLLTLSHNDIELNQSSIQGYYRHIREIWRSGSVESVAFADRVREIKREMSERFVRSRFAVVYYDVPPWPLGDRMDMARQLIEGAARELGVPFLDLSLAFSDWRPEGRPMVASAGDYHPSADAHGRAARFLARGLMKFRLLDGDSSDRLSVVSRYRDSLRTLGRPGLEAMLHCMELAGYDPLLAAGRSENDYFANDLKREHLCRVVDDAMAGAPYIVEDAFLETGNFLREAFLFRAQMKHLRAHFEKGVEYVAGYSPRVPQGCAGNGTTIESGRNEIEGRRAAIEEWLSGLLPNALPARFRDGVESVVLSYGVLLEILDLCEALERLGRGASDREASSDLGMLLDAARSWSVWASSWSFGAFLSAKVPSLNGETLKALRTRIIVLARWESSISAALDLRFSSSDGMEIRLTDARSLVKDKAAQVYTFDTVLSFSGRLELSLSSTLADWPEETSCSIESIVFENGDEAIEVAGRLELRPGGSQCIEVALLTECVPVPLDRLVRELESNVLRARGRGSVQVAILGANVIGLALARSLMEKGVDSRIADTKQSGEEIEGMAILDPGKIPKDAVVALASPRYWREMESQLRGNGHMGPLIWHPRWSRQGEKAGDER